MKAKAAVSQARDNLTQAKYNRGLSSFQAARLDNDKQRARIAGTTAENNLRLGVEDLVSTQRVQGAAGNIDINSGSIAMLQDQAYRYGGIDAMRIRDATDLETTNIGTEADLLREKGRMGVQIAEQNLAHTRKYGIASAVLGSIGDGISGAADMYTAYKST